MAHPFAVAVFKNTLYWDDWKQTAVFLADKDLGIGIVRIQNGLQGLMDLKVSLFCDSNVRREVMAHFEDCVDSFVNKEHSLNLILLL